MKSYVVGGAVRDRLLGLPVSDRDHVVVGATVDEMLAAGYKPVGRDFPVFLHPETHEEYALARTERKVAPGYAGFVFHADPGVTLEADLERRDLTINAIAEDEATGALIDPYGGQRDLDARVFRHVGPAFAEDPVRVLRVARFAARFTDFVIAPETLSLMRSMAGAGEIDALVPERVWQELSRGLMEALPSRMFDVLRDADASGRLLPELATGTSDAEPRRVLHALDRAAAAGSGLDVRFAVLLHEIRGDGTIATLCERLAVPRATRDLAVLVAAEGGPLLALDAAGRTRDTSERYVDAMERCDAFRRRPRFRQAIEAIGWTLEEDAARIGFIERVVRVADAAAAVDAGRIAREASFDPKRIVERLRAARVAAVESLLGH